MTECKENFWKGKKLSRPPLSGKRAGSNSWDRRKQRKAKKTIHKMVLGSDICLTETCSLALCGLVGRLSYHYLWKVSFMEWIDINWKLLLGYKPELVRLTKGWIGIICKRPEDTTVVSEVDSRGF